MNLSSIEQRFIKKRSDHLMRTGQRDLLLRQQKITQERITEIKSQTELFRKTQDLLLKASSTARSIMQEKLESLVSLALSSITGEPYGFKVEFTQSAGVWNAQFFVVNPDGIQVDPLGSCGGGIVDICGMALRIAVLEMYEPVVEGPILLDESFKFLSKEYTRAAADFLRTISQKTGRQIVLVTHIPELAAAADTYLEVQPTEATSKVVDLTSQVNLP